MKDLDWLARNVHEWPDGESFIRLDDDGEVCFTGGNGVLSDFYPDNREDAKRHFCKFGVHTGKEYTRDQWQTRRAELQGKPSWDDAPEWAEWLCQDPTGIWEWHHLEPTYRSTYWWSFDQEDCFGEGEVLGDWRNTLERRPESKCDCINPSQCWEPCGELGHDERYAKRATVNLEGVSDTVNLSNVPRKWTGPEDVLPPVGKVCELYTGEHVEIIAHAHNRVDNVAIYKAYDQEGCLYTGFKIAGCFRPIRSEEDKTVEEMFALHSAHEWTAEEFARTLYRHGYRKLDTTNPGE